jgi:hypothetical protein
MLAVHRWSVVLFSVSVVLSMARTSRAEPPKVVVRTPKNDEPIVESRKPWGVDYVTAGFAYSWVNFRHDLSNRGGGPELSYILYPDRWRGFGIGGFARYFTYGDITAGLEAVGGDGVLGMEFGYTHRSSYNGYVGAHCLHIAPFLSLGVVYVGLALTIPVFRIGDPNQPNLGYSSTTILGVKLPVRWHGEGRHNWAKGLFGGG